MPSYEHVFLARQDLSQAQVDELAQGASKLIEENKGSVVRTETWGLKPLTYKIERNRKAHFIFLAFDAPGSIIAELERQARLNEDVLRYLTVKVEEHEGGPSAMMRKNDRDRRRPRNDGGRDGGNSRETNRGRERNNF